MTCSKHKNIYVVALNYWLKVFAIEARKANGEPYPPYYKLKLELSSYSNPYSPVQGPTCVCVWGGGGGGGGHIANQIKLVQKLSRKFTL